MAFELERDDWLSEMLGINAHVLKNPSVKTSSSEALKKQLSGLGPAFVSAKIDCADIVLAKSLTGAGFYLADTNLLFEKPVDSTADEIWQVRFASPSDKESVMQIASKAFTCSRFHLDPHISTETAGRLKAEWAGNFFSGKRGRWMIVSHDEKRVTGFNLVLEGSAGDITIDLIAVDPEYQGKGLAAKLIAFAESNCNSPSNIRAGTQAVNYRSISLYERLGFRLKSASYVFHHWNAGRDGD